MDNPLMTQRVPIPLETCLTLADAKQDARKPNKYWFDYPADWITSLNVEKIVGIRKIHLFKSARTFKFKLKLRKYLKSEFKTGVADYYASISKPIPSDFDYINVPMELLENIMNFMKKNTDKYHISEIVIPIKSWMNSDEDFRKLYRDILRISQPYIEEYNKRIESSTETTTLPKFCMSMNNPQDRDYQTDGRYTYNNAIYVDDGTHNKHTTDLNVFIEKVYSPRNNNLDDPHYVDIAFDVYSKDTDRRIVESECLDFLRVFNMNLRSDDASTGNFYMWAYYRSMDLKNVWDRTECIVKSSLTKPFGKNYIGKSGGDFVPIKYYTLNSTDTKFFVEFYSAAHPDTPIMIPPDEMFVLELQLQSSTKLLYI